MILQWRVNRDGNVSCAPAGLAQDSRYWLNSVHEQHLKNKIPLSRKGRMNQARSIDIKISHSKRQKKLQLDSGGSKELDPLRLTRKFFYLTPVAQNALCAEKKKTFLFLESFTIPSPWIHVCIQSITFFSSLLFPTRRILQSTKWQQLSNCILSRELFCNQAWCRQTSTQDKSMFARVATFCLLVFFFFFGRVGGGLCQLPMIAFQQ